jgi:hypothetical protein
MERIWNANLAYCVLRPTLTGIYARPLQGRLSFSLPGTGYQTRDEPGEKSKKSGTGPTEEIGASAKFITHNRVKNNFQLAARHYSFSNPTRFRCSLTVLSHSKPTLLGRASCFRCLSVVIRQIPTKRTATRTRPCQFQFYQPHSKSGQL